MNLPIASGPITALNFIPGGGDTLLSASYDNVRMWNLNSDNHDHDHLNKERKKVGKQSKIILGHHGGIISNLCESLLLLKGKNFSN